ncbi:MAG: hypothetical protein IJW74_05595, partial [Oscillospiraceae bacterium]|nr:hypothetical protein [Oscillospiraceae bacterium]
VVVCFIVHWRTKTGINLKAMQSILGHADSGTTLDIYTDATDDMKQGEIISLDAYFTTQQILRKVIG